MEEKMTEAEAPWHAPTSDFDTESESESETETEKDLLAVPCLISSRVLETRLPKNVIFLQKMDIPHSTSDPIKSLNRSPIRALPAV